MVFEKGCQRNFVGKTAKHFFSTEFGISLWNIFDLAFYLQVQLYMSDPSDIAGGS